MSKPIVERELYEKNGKQYFSYFIKGNIRGKDVKIAVAPPTERDKDNKEKNDIGGYTLLDIVFGDEMQAELVAVPFEMTDEATGQVITGNSYMARNVDENGEVYECKIKPYKPSDKALLKMLMR